MPFKSAAQRRKFAELLVQGKISAETFEEWNRETGSQKLPDHVKKKKKKKKKKEKGTKAKPTRKSTAKAKRKAVRPKRTPARR
jgi:hypothetical protein